MFDSNFTFSASRSPNTPPTPGYSPCTSPAPYATAPFSISDLVDQFAGQRIEREAQICYDSCGTYTNVSSNDDDDDDDDDDDEMNWLIPPLEECDSPALHRAQTFPLQRPHSPSRRTQRQANARLLCSATHREEIAALMARMVDAEEQCLIAPSSAPRTPPHMQVDEGYNSGEESIPETVSRSSSIVVVPTRADRRRASDLVAGGACVSKSIRLRKGRHHRRVRTAETPE